MVYLVVSNHTSFSGVWEQIDAILRAFKAMELPISFSSRIKPGRTNIIIEDFNSFLVEEMITIKERDPATRYVLCLTEYVTQSSKTKTFFNCFSKKSEVIRRLFQWEYLNLGDEYNLFGKLDRFEPKALMREILYPPLARLAGWADTNYGHESMLARRGICFHRVKNLFSLCFATTNAVLNSYSEIFDCELVYLPTLVDLNRTIRNRSKSKKHPGIIFSGRLTRHRLQVLKKLGRRILNAYPLEGGIGWDEEYLLSDTKFKLARLRSEVDILGAETSRLLSAELEKTQLAGVDILVNDLYQYSQNNDNTATYEIYIPQAIDWPYSSPNRTLLSIESGFIPLDYGFFSDHDLNQVALSIEGAEDLSTLLTQDIEKNFLELDKNITSYNEAQQNALRKVRDSFNTLG